MANYADRLSAAIKAKSSRVCVGLDPRVDGLPPPLDEMAHSGPESAAEACRIFCCEIADAVADCAAAVKPQAAFFEALGPAGYQALWDVMAHAGSLGLLVILDAKRSDIGSTAEAYARAYFAPPTGVPPVDALTINGYLGSDGIRPFVQAAEKVAGGIYVLAKTSNPSSGELQDLTLDSSAHGVAVYRRMAELIAHWGSAGVGESGYSAVGAVVGATYPEQLAELRAAVPTVPFLVPGYGAQGAGAGQVAGAFDEDGLGAVVNSSRGIILAYRNEPYASQYGPAGYAAAAAAATADMAAAINRAIGI